MAALSAIVVDDESGLEAIRSDWDALAIRTGSPFSAPAWALAWWRNAAPRRAGLRVVAVADGEKLVGVAPLYATHANRARSAYEVMAARLSPPAGLVAEPSRGTEVCEAVLGALASARPRARSLRFWDRVGSGGLCAGFGEAASGRLPWTHAATPAPLPVISLDGRSYEEWFATRQSKFRQESRRMRRRLEDAEAEFALVGPDRLDRALDAFVELHGARWEGRGGSNALIPGFKSMFAEAAEELLPAGRLRIFTIEAEGRIVAVNILLAAGEEVCGWNSGFDESWSRYSPSMQLTLHAVADAAERGERRVNLGPGRMGYKLRLADGEEEVAMTTVVPRDSHYLVSRARLLPYQLRGAIGRRLSDRAKQRLGRLARR